MERPVESIPPLLEQAPRAKTPLLAVGVVIGLTALARLSEFLPFPLYRCSFKSLTGLPCAFCGGTRSLRALSHFEVAEAFWLNPFVLIAALGLFAWLVVWAVLPRAVTDQWLETLKRRSWGKWIVLLALLNWIFVIRFLPP